MRGGVLCLAGGKECGDDEGVSLVFDEIFGSSAGVLVFFFFSVLYRVLSFFLKEARKWIRFCLLEILILRGCLGLGLGFMGLMT